MRLGGGGQLGFRTLLPQLMWAKSSFALMMQAACDAQLPGVARCQATNTGWRAAMASPQFEDFETTKAFEILQRQRDKLLCCECCAVLCCAALCGVPLLLLVRRAAAAAVADRWQDAVSSELHLLFSTVHVTQSTMTSKVLALW